MEVTCQSVVTMFAVWKESNRNVLLPDSAVDGVIESIARWDKLEALLESALKHLPKMVSILQQWFMHKVGKKSNMTLMQPDIVAATVFMSICRIGIPMSHPVPTEMFIRLKRRVDELDVEALSLFCTAMKVPGFSDTGWSRRIGLEPYPGSFLQGHSVFYRF